MTLDEAIKHCLEVAEEQSRFYSLCPHPCDGTKDCMSLKNGKDMGCVKCAAEHRQLAEWLTQFKEAKRLLKATINDIYKKCSCNTCGCDICEYSRETCDYDDRFTWRHTAEVLKLIGEDDNEGQN